MFSWTSSVQSASVKMLEGQAGLLKHNSSRCLFVLLCNHLHLRFSKMPKYLKPIKSTWIYIDHLKLQTPSAGAPWHKLSPSTPHFLLQLNLGWSRGTCLHLLMIILQFITNLSSSILQIKNKTRQITLLNGNFTAKLLWQEIASSGAFCLDETSHCWTRWNTE